MITKILFALFLTSPGVHAQFEDETQHQNVAFRQSLPADVLAKCQGLDVVETIYESDKVNYTIVGRDNDFRECLKGIYDAMDSTERKVAEAVATRVQQNIRRIFQILSPKSTGDQNTPGLGESTR
jgi:hypothetical protein